MKLYVGYFNCKSSVFIILIPWNRRWDCEKMDFLYRRRNYFSAQFYPYLIFHIDIKKINFMALKAANPCANEWHQLETNKLQPGSQKESLEKTWCWKESKVHEKVVSAKMAWPCAPRLPVLSIHRRLKVCTPRQVAGSGVPPPPRRRPTDRRCASDSRESLSSLSQCSLGYRPKCTALSRLLCDCRRLSPPLLWPAPGESTDDPFYPQHPNICHPIYPPVFIGAFYFWGRRRSSELVWPTAGQVTASPDIPEQWTALVYYIYHDVCALAGRRSLFLRHRWDALTN